MFDNKAKLRIMSLSNTKVSGRGFLSWDKPLLRSVYLDGCSMTDEGVHVVSTSLSNLETLSLSRNDISDTCLPALAAARQLYDLRLSNTLVTGRGVSALFGHPRLRYLYLEGDRVELSVIEQLKASIPRDLTVYV